MRSRQSRLVLDLELGRRPHEQNAQPSARRQGDTRSPATHAALPERPSRLLTAVRPAL